MCEIETEKKVRFSGEWNREKEERKREREREIELEVEKTVKEVCV